MNPRSLHSRQLTLTPIHTHDTHPLSQRSPVLITVRAGNHTREDDPQVRGESIHPTGCVECSCTHALLAFASAHVFPCTYVSTDQPHTHTHTHTQAQHIITPQLRQPRSVASAITEHLINAISSLSQIIVMSSCRFDSNGRLPRHR